jgi:SAM-dependent methyltransferase
VTNLEEAQGYVTDATYADRYYRELSPSWLNYAVKTNGGPSKDLNKHFTYLELGCGNGHSVITHAGVYPHADFYACDIIADHIAHAQALADEFSISNIHLLEESFESLILLNDLPQMDFIVLHGVYSWVSEETRRSIKQILAKQLKPSGIVYLSYNCMPGWSAEIPLRKLLVELARTEQGNAAKRCEQAVQCLADLSQRLNYFKENQSAISAVASYLKQPSNYLAHEFLNEAWDTFYSVDILDEMSEIGLDYVASATLVDNHPMLLIDDQASKALNALSSDRQRRLGLDFACNKRFRRDIYINGLKLVPQLELVKNIQNCVIGSIGSAEQIKDVVQVPRGQIGFNRHFISELRAALECGPMSIADVSAKIGHGNADPIETTRNVMFLIASGELSVFENIAQEGLFQPSNYPTLSEINKRILNYVIQNDTKRAFPCPAFGGGIEIEVAEAIVLEAWLEGEKEPEELLGILRSSMEKKLFPLHKRYSTAEGNMQKTAALVVAYVIGDLIPSWQRLSLIINPSTK